jgi:hypothetical protein
MFLNSCLSSKIKNINTNYIFIKIVNFIKNKLLR